MDLRLVIGSLFIAIGLLLCMAGFVLPATERSLLFGMNLNLVWGAVLTVFGALFCWGAKRA